MHVYPNPPPDQTDVLNRAEDTRVTWYSGRSWEFIAWNARRPMLADPQIRRALTAAIDRDALNDVLFDGEGTIMNSSVPPFHWAFDPERSGIRHDPDGAIRTFEAAGWLDRDGDGVREDASGNPFTLTLATNVENSVRVDLVQLVQAQLSEVGIDVELDVQPGSVVGGTMFGPPYDFDGLAGGWAVDFKHDDAHFLRSSEAETGYGISGTRSAQLDVLIDSIRLTPRGTAKRKV